MRGKNKCKILKEIRQKIADENDIRYVTSECKYRGECSGTCPKCESELRYLERELEKRRALGKKVTFAGVAVTMALSLSSCDEFLSEVSGKELGGKPLPHVTESTDIMVNGEILPPENDEVTEREVLSTCCIPCTHGGTPMGTDESGNELYAYPSVLKVPANLKGMKTIDVRQLYSSMMENSIDVMKMKFPDYYSESQNSITYTVDGYTVIYEYNSNGKLENVKKINPEGTLCAFPG